MRRRGWGRPQGRRAGATCQSEERTPHACCPTGDCRACVRSAAAVILVGAMTAFPSPSPWSRPDDAVRQAQLDAMKRQATGLLALAAVVFVGASLYEGQFPWLGYVRATAEASLVGGLADWFAVTALFRHPLGLPIPHTAIVATRKERIGRILGTFVQNHFLSREVVAANLRAVRPAERAARWLADPDHARGIARQVEGLLRDIGARPDHPLRAAFDTALRDFVDRLQHAPDVIARAEALKQEWLADPAIADLSARLWEAMRRAIVAYATRADGAAPGPLERGLSEFGAALLANDALLAELDDLVIDLTGSAVERYRHEIGDLIAQTVAGWDPEATARRFELAVGRDLQFVRINGTLVGGLVGLLIHTVWHLWH